MTKRIIVTIPLKGLSTGESAISVEAEGYAGQGCTDATAIFRNALGAVKDTELKPEYYETPPEEHLRQGQA